MSKAYKIYILGSKNIIMGQDVNFQEEKSFIISYKIPKVDQSEPTESQRDEKGSQTQGTSTYTVTSKSVGTAAKESSK